MKRQLLIKQRIKYGLTQRELAEKLGYSTISIRKIENGQRNPSIKMANKYCLFFNKEYSELFPDIFLKKNDTKSIKA